MQGDTDTAVDYYDMVSKDYPESGCAPKALFNYAILQLEKGYTDLAKQSFAQVEELYPLSEYGKMSKNYISTL